MSSIIITTTTELEQLIDSSIRKALQEQTPQADNLTSEILTIKQASHFLNLAVQTIYGFTSKNEIPFFKRSKILYFRKSELEAWINEGRKKTVNQIKAELTSNSQINQK